MSHDLKEYERHGDGIISRATMVSHLHFLLISKILEFWRHQIPKGEEFDPLVTDKPALLTSQLLQALTSKFVSKTLRPLNPQTNLCKGKSSSRVSNYSHCSSLRWWHHFEITWHHLRVMTWRSDRFEIVLQPWMSDKVLQIPTGEKRSRRRRSENCWLRYRSILENTIRKYIIYQLLYFSDFDRLFRHRMGTKMEIWSARWGTRYFWRATPKCLDFLVFWLCLSSPVYFRIYNPGHCDKSGYQFQGFGFTCDIRLSEGYVIRHMRRSVGQIVSMNPTKIGKATIVVKSIQILTIHNGLCLDERTRIPLDDIDISTINTRFTVRRHGLVGKAPV